MRAQRNPRKQFPGPARTDAIALEAGQLYFVVENVLKRMSPKMIDKIVEWVIRYVEAHVGWNDKEWAAGKANDWAAMIRHNQEVLTGARTTLPARTIAAFNDAMNILHPNVQRHKLAGLPELKLNLYKAFLDQFQHVRLSVDPLPPEITVEDLVGGNGVVLRSKVVPPGRLTLIQWSGEYQPYMVNWYLPYLGQSAFTEQGRSLWQDSTQGTVMPLGVFEDRYEAIEFYEAHARNTLWTEDYLLPNWTAES